MELMNQLLCGLPQRMGSYGHDEVFRGLVEIKGHDPLHVDIAATAGSAPPAANRFHREFSRIDRAHDEAHTPEPQPDFQGEGAVRHQREKTLAGLAQLPAANSESPKLRD